VKLDPSKPDPLVWSLHDRETAPPTGVWATPALHEDVVYVATHGGRLIALDRDDGTERWVKQLSAPSWPSPVVVDDVLVEGDCGGTLHAYDVADTSAEPEEVWAIPLGGCIESTPAVWEGRLYVGTKAGYVYAIGDA
jgi:outer membrane protein assembly factor BamB